MHDLFLDPPIHILSDLILVQTLIKERSQSRRHGLALLFGKRRYASPFSSFLPLSKLLVSKWLVTELVNPEPLLIFPLDAKHFFRRHRVIPLDNSSANLLVLVRFAAWIVLSQFIGLKSLNSSNSLAHAVHVVAVEYSSERSVKYLVHVVVWEPQKLFELLELNSSLFNVA